MSFFPGFATSSLFSFRVIGLGCANHCDIDVKQGTGIGGHIYIGLVPTCHIRPSDAPVGESIVPGAHGMVLANRWVKAFRHIAGSIYPWHIRLQVLVFPDPFADLYRGLL